MADTRDQLNRCCDPKNDSDFWADALSVGRDDLKARGLTT